MPAFILGRRCDVLGASLPECAVLAGFGGLPAVKRVLACGLGVYRS